MTYTITPAENGKYIRITVVGEITGDVAAKYVLDSDALGTDLGIRCYLVDVTDASNVDSALGNYRFQRDDLDTIPGFDPQACVAVLAAPGDESHDFYVAVAKGAGVYIDLFYDEDEAITHLETAAERIPPKHSSTE